MKRSAKGLLILGALILLPLAAWFGSPRLRAAVYEQMFRLGPRSMRPWCIDRLEGLGAEGAPCLVSLLEVEDRYARVIWASEDSPIEAALLKGLPASLPAIAGGLGDPGRSLRRTCALLLCKALRKRTKESEAAGGVFSVSSEPYGPEAIAERARYLKEAQRAEFEDLAPELIRGAGDPDAVVRSRCYALLACLAEAGRPALSRALDDIDSPDRALARSARVLVRVRGAEMAPLLQRRLIASLEAPDEANREAEALFCRLWTNKEKQTLSLLGNSVTMQGSEKPTQRSFWFVLDEPLAAFLIEVLVSHEAMELTTWKRALQSPRPQIHRPTVLALFRRGDEGLALLLDTLQIPEAPARRCILQAIIQRPAARSKAVLGAVERCLDDPAPDIAATARWILEQGGPR